MVWRSGKRPGQPEGGPACRVAPRPTPRHTRRSFAGIFAYHDVFQPPQERDDPRRVRLGRAALPAQSPGCAGRLAAVAPDPPRARSTRRQLPAAPGRRRHRAEGPVGEPGRRRPHDSARQGDRVPAAGRATGAKPGGHPHGRRAAAGRRGQVAARRVDGWRQRARLRRECGCQRHLPDPAGKRHARPADGRRHAVHRDRPPPHRRNRRAGPADHASGR